MRLRWPLRRERAEKALLLPCRPRIGIGDRHRQHSHEIIEPPGHVAIDRLIQIVGRRVIPLAEPRRRRQGRRAIRRRRPPAGFRGDAQHHARRGGAPGVGGGAGGARVAEFAGIPAWPGRNSCEFRYVRADSWTQVTVVVMPPRTQNLPVTVARRGAMATTRSSQIWLVTASWKAPSSR